jgi:hypothetical protein
VHAEGSPSLIGRVVACEIIAAHPNSLAARILGGATGDHPNQENAAA